MASKSNPLPSTQKAVLMYENGASLDVVKYADVPTPQITSASDIIIKNKFAGINFIEAYFRKGIYPTKLPFIFGREASGVVAAIGSDVTKFKVGDRVAYLLPNTFAQYTKIPDSHVHIKNINDFTTGEDDKDMKVWGATLVQGLTAKLFIKDAYDVKKNDYALVWAAAGGVGTLLTQLIAQKGGHVIAVASTAEKLETARNNGAEYLINSSSENVLEKVMEFTNDNGVQVVYDSIGKDTFEISLAAVARKGSLVSYGNASGVVPPLSINRLSPKNVKLLRPQLYAYVAEPAEWNEYVDSLGRDIANKTLNFDILQTFSLAEYTKAAALLEGRKTQGKLVLEISQ